MKVIFSISLIIGFLGSHLIGQQTLDVDKLSNVVIENLTSVNTAHHESSAFWISSDSMVYVKFKQKSKDDNPTRGERVFDLYLATQEGLDFNVQNGLSKKINSQYVEGPGDYHSMSKTLFFTKSYKSKNTNEESNIIKLKLFMSKRDGQSWSEPVLLNGLDADFNYCHPAYDVKSKRLYFSSDIPGGFGGMDLYFSTANDEGVWSAPINLGPIVNSSANEVFPTLVDDQLFFSKSVENQLDIFTANQKDGSFISSEVLPENINSDKDDFSLVKNENAYYLSSNRKGGKGKDDLYTFNFEGPFIKKSLSDSIIVSVLIYDHNNNALPEANVSISKIDIPTNEERNIVLDRNQKITFSYDLKDHSQVLVPQLPLSGEGSGYVILEQGNQYLFNVSNRDYEEVNQLIDLTDKRSSIAIKMMPKKKVNSKPVVNNPPATKPVINIPTNKGAVVVFENLYYDYNSATLQKGATAELDALVQIMQSNQSIKVQLSSHTDSRGRELYNQDLSDKRAASAKQYLVNRGIISSRIFDIGFGESRIRNHCINGVKCSDDEHKFNRRTEVKILEN